MKKIRTWVISFLSQGLSPADLAMAVSLGLCLGIFPMLGTTSLLCLVAAFLLRLNQPAIQAVNYLVYPLQLLLFIPFLKAGSTLFGSDNFNYSLGEITNMLAHDPLGTMSALIVVNLQGVLVWLLLFPGVFALVYFCCRYLFAKLKASLDQQQ